MQIESSQVLLTGATGGLGRTLAATLSRRGASLVLTGRRGEILESLAASTGGRAVPADLATSAGIEEVLAGAGPVDILIANAGLPGAGPLDSYDTASLGRVLDVNLVAAIRLTHALVPGMVSRGRGHVLLVSSLQGLAATPGAPLYVGTKFALRGFGLALRQDLHGTGVGVSVLLPGFVSEAGMFADSGATLPPGIGTRSPAQVACAAVRAIERDRAEVTVAPLHLAIGSYLGGLAPGAAERVQRLLGGRRIADAVSSGLRDKR